MDKELKFSEMKITPNALWFHTLQDLVYGRLLANSRPTLFWGSCSSFFPSVQYNAIIYTVSVTDDVLIKVLDIIFMT